MTALACSSHLLVDLPLFGGPVAFVIGAVLMIRRSERRRLTSSEGAEPSAGLGARARARRSGRTARFMSAMYGSS